MKAHSVRVTVRGLCIYVGSFVLLQVSIGVWRHLSNGEDHHHARWLRLRMLLALQYLMFILSVVLWNRMQAIIPSKQSTSIPILASSGVWRRFLVVLLCCAHCAFPFYYVLVSHEPHWLALICLISYAFYIQTGVLVFAALVVEQILERAHARFPAVLGLLPNLLREAVLSRKAHTLTAIVLAGGMTLLGLYTTQQPPLVKPLTVKLPGMSEQLSGVRIALLTDVHIGPSVGRARVQQIVHIVNGAKPDVIAIAGDLVDGELHELQKAAEPLKDLSAPLGVFFATGNHEYYHGNIDQWLDYLSAIQVHPLHNTNQRFNTKSKCTTEDSACVCLAGVDDISAAHMRVGNHHMNISAALSGCKASDTTVVLAHQPAAAVKILAETRLNEIQLILSGHTHGGQMYVIAPMAWLVNRYFLGLYTHSMSDTQIYVSAGVNYWGPPVKMYAMNEITMIELVR